MKAVRFRVSRTSASGDETSPCPEARQTTCKRLETETLIDLSAEIASEIKRREETRS